MSTFGEFLIGGWLAISRGVVDSVTGVVISRLIFFAWKFGAGSDFGNALWF